MQLELELDEIELGGYDHYMAKEIAEQRRRCGTAWAAGSTATRAGWCSGAAEL